MGCILRVLLVFIQQLANIASRVIALATASANVARFHFVQIIAAMLSEVFAPRVAEAEPNVTAAAALRAGDALARLFSQLINRQSAKFLIADVRLG